MSNNRTKYHFIINPVSGKGKGPENFRHKLENYRKHDDRDIILHTTNGALDALDTGCSHYQGMYGNQIPPQLFLHVVEMAHLTRWPTVLQISTMITQKA